MSEWTDIGAFLLFKNTLAEHIDNNDTGGGIIKKQMNT